jgi:hypothetical protein
MSKTSIQNRKLRLIERVINLEDDKILQQFEELVDALLHNPSFKKLTKEELISRAIQSEKDIENGDYYSLDEVKKISDNW